MTFTWRAVRTDVASAQLTLSLTPSPHPRWPEPLGTSPTCQSAGQHWSALGASEPPYAVTGPGDPTAPAEEETTFAALGRPEVRHEGLTATSNQKVVRSVPSHAALTATSWPGVPQADSSPPTAPPQGYTCPQVNVHLGCASAFTQPGVPHACSRADSRDKRPLPRQPGVAVSRVTRLVLTGGRTTECREKTCDVFQASCAPDAPPRARHLAPPVRDDTYPERHLRIQLIQCDRLITQCLWHIVKICSRLFPNGRKREGPWLCASCTPNATPIS